MTRKKVKLAYIVNDNARKASLKKRRTGLTKKMNDLSILCDVKGCLIIYNPEEEEPMVWPSRETASSLIERFFSLPEIERKKKSVNQETYLKERLEKVNEMLVKTQMKNRELRMDHILFQIQGGGGRSINDLGIGEMYGLTWFSREKIGELRKRLDFIQHIPNQRPPNTNTNADFSGGPLEAADREFRDLHLMEQCFQVNGNNGAPTIGNSKYNNREMGLAFPYEGFHGGQVNVNANVDRFLQAQASVNPSLESFLGLQANANPNVASFLEAQGNVNPNLESFLGLQAYANPYVDRSFTNLVLGPRPQQQEDSNSSMGLGLGLAPRHDLPGSSFGTPNRNGADGRSSSCFGPPNLYGADGGSSFGPPNYRYGADPASSNGGELGMPFGLFGEGAGHMGVRYDVNNGWPDNNNFNL